MDKSVIRKVYDIYQERHGITFIMEECLTKDGEPISLEVKGFYYGEPTDLDNRTFYGDFKAIFGDPELQRMKTK